MKWLQQKWYDVSIRTKSILLMGMMLAVTWVLVALVMIQLHTFSERSSVIMDEYMDITGFMDAFSAENASLEAYMRPIQPIDAKEDYLAAIQMTNRLSGGTVPRLASRPAGRIRTQAGHPQRNVLLPGITTCFAGCRKAVRDD